MDRFPYTRFPEHVMVQTTTRCNAACVFCPYPTVSKELRHKEMTFTLFRKLMNECGRHEGIKGIMLFLMNEPLIDPQIIERINYAKEQNPNASINLSTNGCNLPPDLAERLAHSYVDYIAISIHAQWPETFRQLTGRKDSEVVQRNVVNFVEARNRVRPSIKLDIKLIGAQQFLTNEEVAEAERFWQGHGVDKVDVYLGHTNRAGNLAGTYKIARRTIRGCGDGMPYHMAAIVSNGDVVLCCMDWRREVVMGNVNRQSLAQIWHSAERRRVMEQIQGEVDAPMDFLCKRCMESIPADKDHVGP
jgi:radical SAM protein with 4Fe4S-binding SPASM domain